VKALVHERYGSSDMLELREVEQPEVTDDGVLVRVLASSVNPTDWYGMTGRPFVARPMQGMRKPKSPLLGVDFAGVVEAVGKDVAGLDPGDEVYGGRSGALAELVNVKNAVARKPANLTFEQAAAIPVAATTALQGLRDHGRLQAGQRVLINGASGGVGTFAIQIAKALGAHVTGVASSANLELMRSLGADDVIDYTRADFTARAATWDVILDNVENRSLAEVRRALTAEGTLVLNSGTGARGLGMLVRLAAPIVLSPFSRQSLRRFISNPNQADLVVLRDMVEAGQVRPVVHRTFRLDEAVAALQHIAGGHARGKVVLVT